MKALGQRVACAVCKKLGRGTQGSAWSYMAPEVREAMVLAELLMVLSGQAKGALTTDEITDALRAAVEETHR